MTAVWARSDRYQAFRRTFGGVGDMCQILTEVVAFGNQMTYFW
jgi:hypothetical protein